MTHNVCVTNLHTAQARAYWFSADVLATPVPAHGPEGAAHTFHLHASAGGTLQAGPGGITGSDRPAVQLQARV